MGIGKCDIKLLRKRGIYCIELKPLKITHIITEATITQDTPILCDQANFVSFGQPLKWFDKNHRKLFCKENVYIFQT